MQSDGNRREAPRPRTRLACRLGVINTSVSPVDRHTPALRSVAGGTAQSASVRDADLCCHFASGDVSAAATLFDRYGGAMYAYARQLTGSAEKAESAVTAAFVEARSALPRSRRDHTTGLWLLGLVRIAASADPRDSTP